MILNRKIHQRYWQIKTSTVKDFNWVFSIVFILMLTRKSWQRFEKLSDKNLSNWSLAYISRMFKILRCFFQLFHRKHAICRQYLFPQLRSLRNIPWTANKKEKSRLKIQKKGSTCDTIVIYLWVQESSKIAQRKNCRI